MCMAGMKVAARVEGTSPVEQTLPFPKPCKMFLWIVYRPAVIGTVTEGEGGQKSHIIHAVQMEMSTACAGRILHVEDASLCIGAAFHPCYHLHTNPSLKILCLLGFCL